MSLSSEGCIALAFGVAFLAAAAVCFALSLCLRPLLMRYALSKPNARSSHKIATPQGGGIAVIAATVVVVAATEIFLPGLVDEPWRLAVIFAAAVGLAVVGATDDLRPMGTAPRLLLQVAAVATVISTLPHDVRVVPALPWWLDRAAMLVGGVWLVNVVNFMDGIDWMTVAEIVPVTASLALFGLTGALPRDATLVAATLCGAMIGFAPLNRPVARLFLGDVGSLSIGLLLAWLLVLLASHGYFAAAALLPLYYLADATITLVRRFINGEPVTQAHRSHYYQRALDSGFTVHQIIARVFFLNIALGVLASVTMLTSSVTLQVMSFAAGCALVAALLWIFNSARSETQKAV